jgi:hypothetical protein
VARKKAPPDNRLAILSVADLPVSTGACVIEWLDAGGHRWATTVAHCDAEVGDLFLLQGRMLALWLDGGREAKEEYVRRLGGEREVPDGC